MIAGGRETIRRFRPVMMIELIDDHLARAGDSLASAWAALGSIGYRPFRWVGAAEIAAIEEPREGDIFWRAADG